MSFYERETEKFLTSRIKERGGFGATPLLPETLEDTYFGTLACFYLSKDLFKRVRPKILTFLNHFEYKNIIDPYKFYQIIKIYSLSEVKPPLELIKFIKILLRQFQPIESLNPSKIFSLWYLSNFLGYNKIKGLIENKVNSLKFQTLEELYYLSEINQALKSEYLDFVLKSQNGDGGFGFYPGTTSYIENTYFALKILSSLTIQRSVFLGAYHFILACYNRDGGFSRRPGGISYLETTALSLEILNSLSNSLSI